MLEPSRAVFPVGPDQFKGVSSGKDGNGKPPIFFMSMNGDHLYTGGTLQYIFRIARFQRRS